MRLLPHDRFTIQSPRTTDEISARLSALVRPFGGWKSLRELREMLVAPDRPFSGSVQPDGRFKIWRTIRYRNSFLPVVEGRIRPDICGSRVEVRMRLNRFSAVFVAVWTLFASGAAAFAFSAADRGQTYLGLAPLGFVLFGYLLSQGGFWFEAPRARRFLEEIANGPNAVAELEGTMCLRKT